MILYYDREGKPIESIEGFAAIYENRAYRIVAQVELPNGRWVSTVWLGLDHGYGEGPPLIFETMVFSTAAHGESLEQDRYATEAEALAGHAAMVKKWIIRPNKKLKKRIRLKKCARSIADSKKASRRLLGSMWYQHTVKGFRASWSSG